MILRHSTLKRHLNKLGSQTIYSADSVGPTLQHLLINLCARFINIKAFVSLKLVWKTHLGQ